MLNRQLRVWCAVALLGYWLGSIQMVATAGAAGAGTSLLTFEASVALPGVFLPAGTYIFESVHTGNAWPIVRVSSADRRTLYFAGFTQPVETDDGVERQPQISFGETAPDGSQRIDVWWPRHESRGYRFLWI
jgi:hypothetical protein